MLGRSKMRAICGSGPRRSAMGFLRLNGRGALDPDVPVRQSFMIGSDELYAWADRNPRVAMLRTEHCNDPALIARNYAMTSVNGALQVDLHGQANASRVKGQIYSGFGGSTDFIVGALHSSGGRSFMALPSWHPKAGYVDDRVRARCSGDEFPAVSRGDGTGELPGSLERVSRIKHGISSSTPRIRPRATSCVKRRPRCC